MMHDALPRHLMTSLAVTDAPRLLLIRHADRPPIPARETGLDVPLTATGEMRAGALGHHLEDELAWAVSSPARRCLDTAHRAGVNPGISHLLGDPGPFVIDPARGAEVFGTLGTQAVVRAQIRGETWDFLRPLEEGARTLLRHLFDLLEHHGRTGLAVSHDAIILPVLSWATGDSFDLEWLSPLDGAVLTPGALVWKGTFHEVQV